MRCLCLLLAFAFAFACAAPAIAQEPNDKAIEAGWQALQKGDGARAAAVFDEALKRHPRDPVLLFGSGVAAHLLGRDSDAADSLKRALDLNPRLTSASELLGEIEYLQG